MTGKNCWYCCQRLLLTLLLGISTAFAGAEAVVAQAPPVQPGIDLNHEERAFLQTLGKVRVANEMDWPPFDFNTLNQPAGLSIDYIRLVAEKLGLELEFVSGMTWDELLNQVRQTQIDILPVVYFSNERQAFMHFTRPYYVGKLGVFMHEKAEALYSIQQLKQMQVGIQKGDGSIDMIRRQIPGIELTEIANTRGLLEKLATRELEAVIINVAPGYYYARQDQLTSVRLVDFIDTDGMADFIPAFHMGVRKDWPIMRDILQKALDSITVSEHQHIQDKWLSFKVQTVIDYTLLWQVLAVAALLILVFIYWNRKLYYSRQATANALQNLERLQQELSREHQFRERFLSNMSHEMRTPLNGMLGLVKIGLRDFPDKGVQHLLNRLADTGDHLLNLINDILDLSKLEEGKFELESRPLQLNALLQQCRDIIGQDIAQKGLYFRVEAEQADIEQWYRGDRVRILQVLLNLLSNAVKFTPSGGVTLNISRMDRDMRFAVADTGVGISAADQARLFERFEQACQSTTRQFGGTGLGLAIAKMLAEMMGGSLQVSSEPGRGSTFVFSLPLPVTAPPDKGSPDTASPDTASPDTASPDTASPDTGSPDTVTANSPAGTTATHVIAGQKRLAGYHVLAADDIDINRLIIEDLLRHEAAEVTLAEDGRHVVDLWQSRAPGSFDVVLMDIQMPGMDGYQATEAILKIDPGQVIIGVSAYALQEERERAKTAGMQAYLTKPLDNEQLIETIRSLVMKETPLPDENGAQALVPQAGGSLPDGPTLHYLDLAAMLERYKGKTSLVNQLLSAALKSCEVNSKQLRLALKVNDAETIRQVAHRVKGVMGNLRVAQLMNLAIDVETVADALSLQDKARVNALLHGIEAFSNEIAGMLDDRFDREDNTEDKAGV